jgi:hypothetical protein
VPENPRDEVLAIGIWGQYLYVDRTRALVIVKTSVDYDFDIRDHETVEVFRAIAGAGDPGGGRGPARRALPDKEKSRPNPGRLSAL